jgi:hypothetical protein
LLAKSIDTTTSSIFNKPQIPSRTTAKSFRQAVNTRKSKTLAFKKEGVQPKLTIAPRKQGDKVSGFASELSETLEKQDPNDFVLRPPLKSSPNYLKCKIYFFNTPKFLEIEISQHDLAHDVVRHIITLYKQQEIMKDMPLEHP